MQILTINIGKEQPSTAKASGKTGIFKHPTHGEVYIHAEGVENDTICDKKNHGGVDQAVYVYGEPDYQWWAGELGKPLENGAFGENLTVSHLESAELIIGDRLQIGDQVVLEVTAGRIPCATLAMRMDDPHFVKRFRKAERPGVYCRVIQTGSIKAGDKVTIIPYTGDVKITVREMFAAFFDRNYDPAWVRQLLQTPIAIRARTMYETYLAEFVS